LVTAVERVRYGKISGIRDTMSTEYGPVCPSQTVRARLGVADPIPLHTHFLSVRRIMKHGINPPCWGSHIRHDEGVETRLVQGEGCTGDWVVILVQQIGPTRRLAGGITQTEQTYAKPQTILLLSCGFGRTVQSVLSSQ
jgi:hypothetical protein